MRLPIPHPAPTAPAPWIDVHPLRRSELGAAGTLRHPVVVSDRLERQRRGECLYSIGWVDGRAVGQLLLHWRRPAAVSVDPHIDGMPYIEDLFVLPEARRRGVATALLSAAEAAVAAGGRGGLSLAVSVDNDDARRVYDRLGYVEAGIPPHPQPTSEHGADGVIRSREETVVDLVRWVGSRLRAPVRPGTPAGS